MVKKLSQWTACPGATCLLSVYCIEALKNDLLVSLTFSSKAPYLLIICHNSMVIQNIIHYQWEGLNWFVDLIEKKSNGSRQCSWPRWSL